jgi:hypothetical protein
MNRPIDAAIDFMGLPNASFWGDSAIVLTDSWSQHVASWTGHQRRDISVIRYEDLLLDPDLWFAAIARQIFGDRGVPQESIRLAVERCSFARLRAQEDKSGYVGIATGSERFFRTGRAAQWREALTPAQIERIVNNHGELMRQYGYLPIS